MERGGAGQLFCRVRLGGVLGSRGRVILQMLAFGAASVGLTPAVCRATRVPMVCLRQYVQPTLGLVECDFFCLSQVCIYCCEFDSTLVHSDSMQISNIFSSCAQFVISLPVVWLGGPQQGILSSHYVMGKPEH